jgi:hypothetical protein
VVEPQGVRMGRCIGYGTISQTVHVNVGATVTGRVVAGGKPQRGVRIGFDHRDRNSANFLGREEIGTDEQGFFVMTGLGDRARSTQSSATTAASRRAGREWWSRPVRMERRWNWGMSS